MKTMRLALLLASTFLLMTQFSSCLEDSCTQTEQFYIWEPIFTSLEEIRSEVTVETARELENPGKIYFYNNYIFVSELNEGIHVIDNSDPTNPVQMNFIKIPNNRDMAVKNGRLYADHRMDLVTIDITDPTQPTLSGRTENVFTDYSYFEDSGYLTGYTNTFQTQEFDCNSEIYQRLWGWCGTGYLDHAVFANDAAFSTSSAITAAVTNASVPSTPSVGTGGSFARFTISKNHLYAVSEYDLHSFDLENCDDPSFKGATHIGWGIETIFPQGDNLFIGSINSLFIYGLEEPSAPVQLSQFRHARACDPVFVDGDKAYVTLRDGNFCQGTANQLDVLDISDLFSPVRIISHAMEYPHGLSVLGDHLFVCEGEHGLKVFDRTDDYQISEKLLSTIPNIHAYDIITLSNNRAMVIGHDGLYQYDTTDPTALKEISRITVNR